MDAGPSRSPASPYGERVHRVRTALPSEAVVLTDLERAASGTALGHVFGAVPFPYDDVLARWALVLGDSATTVLLDEEDGVAVGYAAYGDGWLHHLGVLPEHWGSGRAQALHACVLAAAAAAGAPTSYLWVLVDNHRARAFYRRLDWRDTDLIQAESFAPYPDRMQMTRSLDSLTPEGMTPWT